jgi:hypothetical protein
MADVPEPRPAGPYENLEVGRLFARTFSLYFRNFFQLTAITLLVSLPSLIWTLIRFSEVTLEELTQGSPGGTAYTIGSNILALVLQPLATGAVVFEVVRVVKTGQIAPIGQSLRVGLAYLPRLIGVGLCTTLILVPLGLAGWGLTELAGGLGVLLVLVVILPLGMRILIGLFVAVPAVVTERAAVMAALRRSWDLTSGQGWRIFLLLLIVGAIYAGVLLVFMVFGIMGGGMRDPLFLAKISLGVGAALLPVLLAVGAVAPTLTYFELKRLKEGIGIDDIGEIFS